MFYYLAINWKGSSCYPSISGASTSTATSTWADMMSRIRSTSKTRMSSSPSTSPSASTEPGTSSRLIDSSPPYLHSSEQWYWSVIFRNFLISDRFCTNCVKDLFMRHEFIFSIFLRRHGLTESWSGQGQNTWCGGEGTRDHPPPQRHTPLFAKRYSSTDRGKICYTKLFGKWLL